MTSEREGFEHWLDYMEDALCEFFAELPEQVSANLDYSVESLNVLKAWLLERYPSCDAARQETDPHVFDGAARYIGETFRKKLGGYWTVDLVNRSYHGLPLIIEPVQPELGICPLALATASTDRRRGDYLSTILRNNLARPAAAE